MSRLRIMSELHLEFGPLELEPLGEDVLVLAGDIDLGARGFAWFSRGYYGHEVNPDFDPNLIVEV